MSEAAPSSYGMVFCEFTMPLRLVAEVNAREHWRARHKRSQMQHMTTTAIGLAALRRVAQMSPPYHVSIVRVGPRRMDMDNVIGSAKHVRDAVAKLLDVDDGDEARVKFEYGQRATGRKLPLRPYQVEVAIEGAQA